MVRRMSGAAVSNSLEISVVDGTNVPFRDIVSRKEQARS